MSHLVLMAAQMQRLFQLSLDLRERAAHAMALQVAPANLTIHYSTARSV
jgi:hypothetical protein